MGFLGTPSWVHSGFKPRRAGLPVCDPKTLSSWSLWGEGCFLGVLGMGVLLHHPAAGKIGMREVGGGIGMGKTCEPEAFSFQCMTKFTTN